jgi:hypothetical protein
LRHRWNKPFPETQIKQMSQLEQNWAAVYCGGASEFEPKIACVSDVRLYLDVKSMILPFFDEM